MVTYSPTTSAAAHSTMSYQGTRLRTLPFFAGIDRKMLPRVSARNNPMYCSVYIEIDR